MYLHEKPLLGPEAVFPQRRVTPEELTRALAAIEARKQEAARHQEAEQAYLEKTIPVDEAVRELSLEATPEEIWAEVEAQRAAEPDDKPLPEGGQETETTAPLAPDFSPLYTQAASAAPLSQRRQWSRGRVIGAALATSVIGLVLALSHHQGSIQSAGMPFVQAGTSAYNVANFPDAIPFELTGHDLNSVLHGEDTSKIGVDPGISYNANGTPGWWSLIKYDGHVYLRGYIAAPPTEEALPGRTVDIDNMELVPENGDRPAEVTLRLDTLKYCSFYERITTLEATSYTPGIYRAMDEKITVADVHLDQHAWERARGVISTKQPVFPANFMQRLINDQGGRSRLRPLQNTGGTSPATYPDEKPFLLKDQQLSLLLTGAPLATVYASASQGDLDHPEKSAGWLAVKHQGSFYLRGWFAGDATQKGWASRFLHLYNSASPAELSGVAKPISLRLGNFQYGPSGRFYAKGWYFGRGKGPDETDFTEQVVLSNVHLDNHAYEKWHP